MTLFIKKIKLVLRQHLQAIQHSVEQLGRTLPATLMTFAVIGITLSFPLGLSVMLHNAKAITSGLHETAQISLFLKAGTKQDQVDNLLKILNTDNDIAKTEYISPEAGLKSFQEQLDLKDVLSQLERNPLPGEIIVQPREDIKAPLQIKQLLTRLERLPFVDQATLDMIWLQRLHAIMTLGDRVVYAILFLFALAILLIIGNTIRLIVQSYQEEMMILQLFGGTHSFIRRPFLYSGMIYGLAGSFIAILIVNLMIRWLQKPILHLSNLYGTQFHLQGLSTSTVIFLMLTSALLGYIGSFLAVNKYI